MLSEFFKDDNGTYSNMRLMCIVALFSSLLINFYGIITNTSVELYVSMWLGFAFGGKLISKETEIRGGNNGRQNNTDCKTG